MKKIIAAALLSLMFKAFLQGVDGAAVEDFTVAACKGYNLSDLPKS